MNAPPKPTDALIDYKRFAFVPCYFDNNFVGAIAVKVELVNKTGILGVFPILYRYDLEVTGGSIKSRLTRLPVTWVPVPPYAAESLDCSYEKSFEDDRSSTL